ncbi:hypothetical protein EVAR_85871_1 [Eumeta japonica]|uniref:Uncharacterized protein n=1 Tax=Eumeta variegata TaxID=151549 RepID=A0A4C2A1N9_EUMVA|nr:hypothetical protein EVAR_85871_1 [Eumeta japonica]
MRRHVRSSSAWEVSQFQAFMAIAQILPSRSLSPLCKYLPSGRLVPEPFQFNSGTAFSSTLVNGGSSFDSLRSSTGSSILSRSDVEWHIRRYRVVGVIFDYGLFLMGLRCGFSSFCARRLFRALSSAVHQEIRFVFLCPIFGNISSQTSWIAAMYSLLFLQILRSLRSFDLFGNPVLLSISEL